MQFKMILSLYFMLFLSGCLEEPAITNYSNELEINADLLRFLESKGDFINSAESPTLIEAREIYENINNYIIIDLRDSVKFKQGHIEGSININNSELFDFVINISSNSKIIFVSETGQSAAYYASLFRCYGITNIYSLNFGLASWHIDFAGPWLEIISRQRLNDDFVKTEFSKNGYTVLPFLKFNNSGLSIEEKFIERIKLLLEEGFPDTISTKLTPAAANFNSIYSPNIYLICAGAAELYLFQGLWHPPNSIHYYYHNTKFYSDFRSISFLQTIPTDRKIIIYSYNGQRSAYLTAYLRILGYDAASLLYGAHDMSYQNLHGVPFVEEHIFTHSRINNFQYFTE